MFGPDHFKTFNSMTNVGILRVSRTASQTARRFFGEVLAGRRRVLGAKHPATLGNQSNLGWVLSREGLVGEGEQG